jgi:hypothetical protein
MHWLIFLTLIFLILTGCNTTTPQDTYIRVTGTAVETPKVDDVKRP